MADLERNCSVTGKDWLRWAIIFAKKGFLVDGPITVHGPHGPPGDHMWGEASCRSAQNGNCGIAFEIAKTRSIHKIADLKFYDKWTGERLEPSKPSGLYEQIHQFRLELRDSK